MIQFYKVKSKRNLKLLLGTHQLSKATWKIEIKCQRLCGGAACPPTSMRPQSNWGEPSPEAEFEIPHLVGAPPVPASFLVCPGGSGSWPPRHWVPGRS